ncbi:MAG: hypothetical protein RMM28_07820 [Thermoleophilia bacterium]|nr:hypothetical protein [Gaiellaceae bacterium]MDW8339027.1 hypothetical protein [Thermoleophilia bacterium]
MGAWLATAGGFGLELGRPEPVAFGPDALPQALLLLVVGVTLVWLWLEATRRS